MVLWMVVLLGAVTMAASSAARNSSSLVIARRAHATARSMAESGITAAVVTINDKLREFIADSTARDNFLNALDAGTNGGRTALGRAKSDTVGDAAFAVAVVDVDSRLDVNSGGEVALARFLSAFAPAVNARGIAERIAARVRGDGTPNDSAFVAQMARDSLVQSLLGQGTGTSRLRHPFETIDELLEIPGLEAKLLAQVAPMLTVDGDAKINKRSAPRAVITAAAGTLVDAPSRLLIISRGWQIGHPLTLETSAVYDVSANGLRLVRWRERAL